jgi:hypothetical protein
VTPRQKAEWLIANPAELGVRLGYTDFRNSVHGKWLRRMVAGKGDMTLQAHRGSYKTTCLCEAIALLMLKERGKNIIFMRKTDADVAEVVTNVERILRSDVMQQVYFALTGAPLQVLRATNTEITTGAYCAPRGAAQLQGIGIGGSLTGKHADIIITDDIVNLRDRVSRAERERTKTIYMELQNIRNPGGRIINTGTPWHPEDAFCLMPEPERYDCYTTGLLSEAQIAALRQSMSPSLFAANYELRHIASENALFTTPPTFTCDAELLADGIAHIDAAYGGEDYTAFTCGRRRGDKLYLYGRMWHGHVDGALPVILAETKRLRASRILCEDNGDKGFLSKEIKRLGGRASTYHEAENKYIKISTYLRKWWQNIVWLEGTDKTYIRQIMDYTEDAEHDDAPDSAAVMCRWYDQKKGEAYVSPIFGG